MREIPLVTNRGGVLGVALVDDADFELVSRYTWRLLKQRHTSYARASINGQRVYMHRFLCPDADEVDHINHDGLDNRRENLRPATHQQNMQNQSVQGDRTYKGITQRSAECWIAFIKLDSLQFHLGSFTSPELAARAYDEIAWAAWGKWAKLNFPELVPEYERQCRESCYYPDGSPVVP